MLGHARLPDRRSSRSGRRIVAAFVLAVALSTRFVGCVDAQSPERTLRTQMMADVETLDPARAPELGTIYTIAPLYHQLLTYDYLASPATLIPYAATALPQISADRRTYTLTIRPGLMFAPHPAFGGKPRELVAADFVYSWKRVADPAHSSMSYSRFEGLIEGLDEIVARARRESRFDYNVTIAGIRALDKYTLQIRLTRPDATFIHQLAYAGLSAVPKEVVEAEGAEFARRPIGSGPYQVVRFQPATRLDLVRNPNFKPLPWTFFAPGAPASAPVTVAMRSRMVPMIDRVEMIRIPEPSTAVLALTRGEIDFVAYARRRARVRWHGGQARLARRGHPGASGGVAGHVPVAVQHARAGHRRIRARAGGAAAGHRDGDRRRHVAAHVRSGHRDRPPACHRAGGRGP